MLAAEFARLGAVLALVAFGTGCAGARTTVVADTAQYPISLSRAVRDADGTLVASGRATPVARLEFETTVWGLLYSSVKLNPRTDISEAVNEQMAAVNGDAVVNVHVKTGRCATEFFPFLNLLPIWPGCTKVRVEGDIIKVQRDSAPAVGATSTAKAWSSRTESF
ncbi:hypothetical protein AKJ09_08256 [Labilithrix luteola]|uniref:Lipoprotein n=1 Tax=Labilithrix luteola TaxID=1391654 RepID=A0A0K1Q779_9BACT|nr:hypothetical protein [Labilithrix luteola]AKV01593.1 hypothetical protein AKJ09_08256 [Labilithrix luteola]